MSASKENYNCPVEVTLEIISGKWKCVILWWLRQGTKRFNELKLLIPGISQKVLTQQLRELEQDGLVQRDTYREAPPRVEYSLTPYGETLRPITELMCNWGKTHMPGYRFGMVSLEGLHILIVDDRAEILEQLRIELELRTARVTAVAAAVAVEILRQIQPDVVVVDDGISSSYAYALIRQLKVLETEQGKFIPAIALTSSLEERRQAFLEGFQLYLTKPTELIELVAAIANLTGRFG